MARAVGVRLAGLIFYGAAVAWAWWQLPQTLPFVVPAAVLGGGVLHVGKGRPWWGLLIFGLVVVVVPVLLWPALGTGTFSDLTDSFSRD
ncbi:hypothetical protein GCM10009623_16080 [Nocardioides aestuarii]|uniref:AI-2E family transporter n=1 Tax=Nocardioides aestuarii TaxID=252231 RepID=A0ABW4TJY3_9ACTN